MLPTSDFVTAASVPAVVVNPPAAPPELPTQVEPSPRHVVPSVERTVVWNLPFDRLTMEGAVDQIEHLIRRGEPSYVITANLNYAMLHHRQAELKRVSEDAALILADGQPIVWRSKLGKKPLPERVAGSEMIYHLAQRASEQGWSIYFLGGQPAVAASCAERLAQLYPGLRIAGVESPPFRQLSDEEKAAQIERIQNSGASLLLVAFGQPKGECWIHQHYKQLGVAVSIQLGASFDFIAGTAKRAPVFWQRLGAEWAYRMFSDPRRLIPRYAANGMFLCEALIDDWKRKVTSWGMGQWVEPDQSS